MKFRRTRIKKTPKTAASSRRRIIFNNEALTKWNDK